MRELDLGQSTGPQSPLRRVPLHTTPHTHGPRLGGSSQNSRTESAGAVERWFEWTEADRTSDNSGTARLAVVWLGFGLGWGGRFRAVIGGRRSFEPWPACFRCLPADLRSGGPTGPSHPWQPLGTVGATWVLLDPPPANLTSHWSLVSQRQPAT